MNKFSIHHGIAVPLKHSNVDTDQIIPASYLKRITRTGFEDGLFATWRSDKNFVLNKYPYIRGTILVVGEDFGVGSSREHAVWALQNYGFKVIIGSRFGDIFSSNSAKSGLLITTVSLKVVERLWRYIEMNPEIGLTVNLEEKTIATSTHKYSFKIDDYTRLKLLAGLDDIDSTMCYESDISAYEDSRLDFKPTTITT